MQNIFLTFIQLIQCQLTNCGLVNPYGGLDLGQHWPRLLPDGTKPLTEPMLIMGLALIHFEHCHLCVFCMKSYCKGIMIGGGGGLGGVGGGGGMFRM